MKNQSLIIPVALLVLGAINQGGSQRSQQSTQTDVILVTTDDQG